MKRLVVHIVIFQMIVAPSYSQVSREELDKAHVEQLPQQRDLVNYPYREINVGSTPSVTPMCYFIETRNEFNKICREKGITIRAGSKEPSINFFREIVLGVKVFVEIGYRSNPYYRFQVMQDRNTKDIHFFVYHYLSLAPTRQNRTSAQTWIVVPKPMENYQVHFHLINERENKTETIILKNTQ